LVKTRIKGRLRIIYFETTAGAAAPTTDPRADFVKLKMSLEDDRLNLCKLQGQVQQVFLSLATLLITYSAHSMLLAERGMTVLAMTRSYAKTILVLSSANTIFILFLLIFYEKNASN
jgi:hypothetical protein